MSSINYAYGFNTLNKLNHIWDTSKPFWNVSTHFGTFRHTCRHVSTRCRHMCVDTCQHVPTCAEMCRHFSKWLWCVSDVIKSHLETFRHISVLVDTCRHVPKCVDMFQNGVDMCRHVPKCVEMFQHVFDQKPFWDISTHFGTCRYVDTCRHVSTMFPNVLTCFKIVST